MHPDVKGQLHNKYFYPTLTHYLFDAKIFFYLGVILRESGYVLGKVNIFLAFFFRKSVWVPGYFYVVRFPVRIPRFGKVIFFFVFLGHRVGFLRYSLLWRSIPRAHNFF